jgi:hypothetical protein
MCVAAATTHNSQSITMLKILIEIASVTIALVVTVISAGMQGPEPARLLLSISLAKEILSEQPKLYPR